MCIHIWHNFLLEPMLYKFQHSLCNNYLLLGCRLSSLLGICCGKLQYKDEFYHFSWIHLHQLLPMVCIVFHNAVSFLWAMFTSTPHMWSIAWPHALCEHSCWSSILIPLPETMFFISWCGCWVVGLVSACNDKGIIIHLLFIATQLIIISTLLH